MRYLFGIATIVLLGVIAAISACHPEIIAANEFIRKFVEDQSLNILAVIMTISIATIATIHIWFNELEDKHQKHVFGKARAQINQNAMLLILLFIVEVVVLIVRSWLSTNQAAVALCDGLALLIVLCSVFTLADVVGTVKSLTPSD